MHLLHQQIEMAETREVRLWSIAARWLHELSSNRFRMEACHEGGCE
jgi:hypothetical protein